MNLFRNLFIRALLSALLLASTSAVKPPTPSCPPGSLAHNPLLARPPRASAPEGRSRTQNPGPGAPRGVSQNLIFEVAQSSELQQYLRENPEFKEFGENNHKYLSLLKPEDRKGLLQGVPQNPEAAAGEIEILYSPNNATRQLNGPYFGDNPTWTDAGSNHYKRVFYSELSQELDREPELKKLFLAGYNDYKAIGMAFKRSKDPAVRAKMAIFYDRVANQTATRFGLEYSRSPLARLTQGQRPHIAHAETWFTPGSGRTHEEAARASRKAKELNRSGNSARLIVPDFDDPTIQHALQQDLDTYHQYSKDLAVLFPRPNEIIELGATKDQRTLSFGMVKILRSIKTSQVEEAAGENLRDSIRKRFPELKLTDDQVTEMRAILSRPEADRSGRPISPTFATPKMFAKMTEQGFLKRSSEKPYAYTLSSDALAELQAGREDQSYINVVRDSVQKTYGIVLTDPQIRKIRNFATLADESSSSVLQAERSPLDGLNSPFGAYSIDLEGQGARNNYYTMRRLLEAHTPREAVHEAALAFQEADAPLLEMRQRYTRAQTQTFGKREVTTAISGDEIIQPFASAEAIPTREQSDQFFALLVKAKSYQPAEIRFAVGKRGKQAQDLEKEIRKVLTSAKTIGKELREIAMGIEVEEPSPGVYRANLLLSQEPSPEARKAILAAFKKVLLSQKGEGGFEAGAVRTVKISKKGSLRGILLRPPHVRSPWLTKASGSTISSQT